MRLEAWMFVRVFPCCVALCRQRPGDGPIPIPVRPTNCLNIHGVMIDSASQEATP
jgi:hypothetical protein